jgi:uncharacterized protein (TIGR00725 family)
MPKTIVGVMGPGESATATDLMLAEELGRLIALEGWVLLTGGRSAGVMDAALRGASRSGGLTIGISPFSDWHGLSQHVDLAILTGLGEARNAVNVLTSRVVFVCGMNAGTASEVALAIKSERPVILIKPPSETLAFFRALSPDVAVADTCERAIEIARERLKPARRG